MPYSFSLEKMMSSLPSALRSRKRQRRLRKKSRTCPVVAEGESIPVLASRQVPCLVSSVLQFDTQVPQTNTSTSPCLNRRLFSLVDTILTSTCPSCRRRSVLSRHRRNVSVDIAVERSPLPKPFAVTQWLPASRFLLQSLLRLLERQELHLLAVLRHRVVDQLDDLLVLDPAVRVEDQVEDALLDHRAVEGRLPVVAPSSGCSACAGAGPPSRSASCTGTPSTGCRSRTGTDSSRSC